MKSLVNKEVVLTPSFQLTIPGNTLPRVQNQYSILFWLFIPNHDSDYRGILRWGVTDNVRAPGLWITKESGKLHFRVSSTEQENDGSNCAELPFKMWNHINVHRNNDWFAVYLNGQLSCHFRISGEIVQNADDPVFIPPTSNHRGSDDNSRLKLDKVVFVNHPLSKEAISEWYKKGRDFNLIQ
jgi:hypothetical protein